MASENVGDVLASIRRLIAQDGGAGRLVATPDLAAAFRHADLLNARLAASATSDLRQVATPHPEEMTAPLALERDNLVAPEAPSQPVLRLHLAPRLAHLPEPEASVPEPATAALEALAPVWPASAQMPGPAAFPDDPPAQVAESAEIPAIEVATDQPHPNHPAVQPVPEFMAPVSGDAPASPTDMQDELAPGTGADPEDVADLHLFAPEDADLANSSVLRSLIRDAIRQELQGEMGGRFSRNLRQVIRHEVDLALRQARRARSAG